MAKIKRALKVIMALVLAVLLLMPSIPVYAIANPDSGPFILQVDAYQNLDTEGDTLLLVRISIPYGTVPDEPSSVAFIGRLLLAGEEVQSTTPYAYHNSGYNYSTFALYASSGIAWEGAYTVSLSGCPTLDWDDSVPEVSTTTISWRTSASTFLSQSMLASNVLDWASSLSAYWIVALLSTTGSGGSVLSSYGVQYFTNVIPYLNLLCPSVLPTGQTAVAYEDQDFQAAGSTAVMSEWPFDFSGVSDWIGLPDENLLHIILMAGLLAFMCVTLKLDSRLSGAAAFAAIVLAVIPGFLDPIVAAATIFVAILGLALVFILGKSIA